MCFVHCFVIQQFFWVLFVTKLYFILFYKCSNELLHEDEMKMKLYRS